MSILSEERITEFMELHRKHYGSEISREDAMDQGIKLINLMSLIIQAMAAKQAKEETDGLDQQAKD